MCEEAYAAQQARHEEELRLLNLERDRMTHAEAEMLEWQRIQQARHEEEQRLLKLERDRMTHAEAETREWLRAAGTSSDENCKYRKKRTKGVDNWSCPDFDSNYAGSAWDYAPVSDGFASKFTSPKRKSQWLTSAYSPHF